MSAPKQALFVFLFALILVPNAFAEEAVFTDVSSTDPHYEAINYLYEHGIVEGYEDNTFRPGNPVNRAEALKIILLGSDILVPEIADQEIFPDVIHDSWYAKFVTKAKNLGIVNGDSDTGFFRPGDTVNLAEALKILLNTNEIDTKAPDENPYWDVPTDAWFAPYFEYARSISLLDQSSESDVHPATPIDRGMLAELMYRLSQKPKGYVEGKASYYGAEFHGKGTASGEVFDASAFTAAHRTFPFNTLLKVTNLDNQESVVVRVNDRGPYSGDRIIDLSQAAFEAIAPLSRGVITVSIVPVSASASEDDTGVETDDLSANLFATSACKEKLNLSFLAPNSFENITLNSEIPNRFLADEVLTLSGTTTSSEDTVSAFVTDSAGVQHAFYAPVSNKAFSVNIVFPAVGNYQLGLLPGPSGTSLVKDIKVVADNCISESTDTNLAAVTDLLVTKEAGDTKVKWSAGLYQLFKLTFSQGENTKTYLLYGETEFQPNYPDFLNFKEGDVQVSIQGAALTSKSLLEPKTIVWNTAATTTFRAVTHHEYSVNKDQVEIVKIPTSVSANKNLEVVLKAKVAIDTRAAVILPTGLVETVTLTGKDDPIKNAHGVEIFPPGSTQLGYLYKPTSTALHFIEINNSEGLAVVNIPVFPAADFPLLPNPTEMERHVPKDLGTHTDDLRDEFLALINADREKYGLADVKLVTALTNLAQHRADDMVENDYFSHWNAEGLNANDLRKNFAIQQVVAENIAKDVSMEMAEYGLMRSALHRDILLSDRWERMGIGIAKTHEGSYIFVQIFSPQALDLNDTDGLRNQIMGAINDTKTPDFVLSDSLNTLAQNWSDNMADKNFFDFTAPDSSKLVDLIHDTGIDEALGTYIVGNTDFPAAIDQISDNAQINGSQWKDLGVGIAIDQFGVIKITLIYTE